MIGVATDQAGKDADRVHGAKRWHNCANYAAKYTTKIRVIKREIANYALKNATKFNCFVTVILTDL